MHRSRKLRDTITATGERRSTRAVLVTVPMPVTTAQRKFAGVAGS
jgi:hypothetical protein